MRFVLASASPARLSVLTAAGIDPVVRVSGVDEDAVAAGLTDPSPAELVTALAEAKARAVAETTAAEFPDAVIVGCDSMLSMTLAGQPQVVGKPGTAEIATARWAEMSGRNGELLTGHALLRVRAGEVVDSAREHLATTVRFSAPSPAEINAYVATGEPLSVAGGFTLDGLGGWFVEGVDGDPSSVLGLSLPLTRRLLAKLDISVVALWRG